MKTPKLILLLAALVILVLVGTACKKEATPTVEPTEVVVEPTEEPTAEPTEEPTAEPTEAPPPEPCSPATEGAFAGIDPRGQTVIWWHNHGSSREEGLNALLAEFNSTNDCGITVEGQNQGNYDQIRDKVNASIATGELPGLVVGYQNDQAFYALEGGLVDINPYLNDLYWGLTAEDQADFYQAFLQQSVHPAFDNMRLGFPPNRSIEVLYYNQTWLEELGYSGPPTTPEEFREMACAAAAANGDGTGGYPLRDDASNMAAWTFAFGGDVLNEDGTGYIYDGQATIDAMAFQKSLYDDGCAFKLPEGEYPNSYFANRKAIFAIGSSSGMMTYYGGDIIKVATEQGRNPDVWGIAAIPHITPDPVVDVYGGDVMIPSTTPETQLAAWIFIKWYTSPEIQARWAQISGYFPTRISTWDYMGEFTTTNVQFGQAIDLLQYGAFEPQLVSYQSTRDLAKQAFWDIIDGEDITTILTALSEEANLLQADLMP